MSIVMASVQNNMKELRETPEESYHDKLGKMIEKVKAETKWRDTFKIVEEAQRRLKNEI